MDLFSRMVPKEEVQLVPSRRTFRKNPEGHWPLAILLERAGYLRKLAALGDGAASETLKEYPGHSMMLRFRSRSGGAEFYENCVGMFQVLDGRATLVTSGSEVEGHLQIDAPIGSGRGEESSCERIGLSEKRRLKNADRWCKVHIVKDVPRHRREVQ